MTLMQETIAVTLRAVREMQQEFIQAQAAMTQQSLVVHQRALSQQEESLRVQQSLIAQLASSADADPLRKLREKNPQFPAFTGRMIISCPGYLNAKPARSSVLSRMPLPSNTPSWRWETPFLVFFLRDRPFQIWMSL